MDEMIKSKYPIRQWQMTTNAITIDGAWDIVDKLVAEGIRVGKCPWSALTVAEETAHDILRDLHNIQEVETRTESINRWKTEEPPCPCDS